MMDRCFSIDFLFISYVICVLQISGHLLPIHGRFREQH